jgi:hypothetical protein
MNVREPVKVRTSRKRSFIVALILGPLMAVIVVMYLRPLSSSHGAATAPATPAPDTAVAGKVREPNRDPNEPMLRAMAARIERLESELSSRREAKPANATPAPADRGVPPEKRVDQSKDDLLAVEAVMRAEPSDRAWQAEFETTARAALALQEIKGVSINKIACGSTLCRIDMQLSEDRDGDSEHVVQRLSEAAPHGGIWLNKKVLGQGRAVAVVARVGSRLPIGHR